MIRPLVALAAVLLATAAVAQAAPRIDPVRIAAHTMALASDEFEGRAPSTPGETRSTQWIADQFRAAGLEPAGPNGSYFQEVPLYRFTRKGPAQSSFRIGGQAMAVTPAEDILINSIRPEPQARVSDVPVVFVGYGVKADERGWDDFKGMDLKGKLLVMLVNDPDFEAPAGHPTHRKFDGQAMTYYGRWTYKFEEAARQGAAGVLVVHETAGAGYPWTVLKNSDNAPKFDIVRADPASHSAPVQGWIQRSVAEALFRRAGQDFAALKEAAKRADFRPVALQGVTFSTAFDVEAAKITSRNVMARVTGSKHPDEALIYGAHWDAFGRGVADASGDDIYNGAIDNATGVAALIELGRVFAQGPKPERTVIFVSWTAEESGLIGSQHYALNPVVPLETTVGNLNVDSLLPGPAPREIVVIGYGKGELDDWLAREAAAKRRVLIPDPAPQAGAFYRSDHFPLARLGVPVLFPSAGFTGFNAASQDYVKNRYHQPSDEWDPSWTFEGAAEDVQLMYAVGWKLANSRAWPGWKRGAEFAAERQRSAARRK